MGRFLRSVSTDTVDPRQYKNYQEFTSAGSHAFTVPAGVSRIRAIVVGAGGGGACSKTTYYAGNGGGGGGFAMGEYDVTPGQVPHITRRVTAAPAFAQREHEVPSHQALELVCR